MTDIRLATYSSVTGPRAAIMVNGHFHDAAATTGSASYASVLEILEDWDRAEPLIARSVESPDTDGMATADAELLSPLLYPGTIYCAGANYQDHMDAVMRYRGLPPQPSPREVGVGPFFFLKARRSVVGPDVDIVNESGACDFEVELAVVIGRKARSVSAAQALDVVAGYMVANDLSARDRIMRPQLPESSPFKFDWSNHKNFDSSCPLGPWIVPASAIPDLQSLPMRTWVNNELRQDSSTAKMIFSVAEQIEALSRFNTLYPGDVILTGTPAGVGAESGTWLKAGDVVRMEIGGIGQITSRSSERRHSGRVGAEAPLLGGRRSGADTTIPRYPSLSPTGCRSAPDSR